MAKENTTTLMTNEKALAYVLENCELPAAVAEKITRIHESIAKKKNANGSKKNSEAVQAILTEITDTLERGKKYLVSEISKTVPSLNGASTSKTTSYVNWLREDGKLQRTIEKGKSYYSLVG